MDSTFNVLTAHLLYYPSVDVCSTVVGSYRFEGPLGWEQPVLNGRGLFIKYRYRSGLRGFQQNGTRDAFAPFEGKHTPEELLSFCARSYVLACVLSPVKGGTAGGLTCVPLDLNRRTGNTRVSEYYVTNSTRLDCDVWERDLVPARDQ